MEPEQPKSQKFHFSEAITTVTEHPISNVRTKISPVKFRAGMKTPTSPPSSPRLRSIITEATGDIFTAPSHSILLHACNTKGSWGAGVAAAFQAKYPGAYNRYRRYCITPPQSTNRTPASAIKGHQVGLLGTCLLIDLTEQKAPTSKAAKKETKNQDNEDAENVKLVNEDRFPIFDSERNTELNHRPQPRTQPSPPFHYIACLFTSYNYGRNKDKPEEILSATRTSLSDLKAQLTYLKEQEPHRTIGDIWAVKINSGLFAVDWEKTKAVLEESGLPMRVVSPPTGTGSGGAAAKRRGGAVRLGNENVKKQRVENDDGGDEEEEDSDDRDEDEPRGLKPVNICYPISASKRANDKRLTKEKHAGKQKKQGALDGWLK